jgi:hypothetical protein
LANVPHQQVPGFLSASDFGFSLVKPSPNRKYCSPVKNGEYWANGLPIILPADVGDDAALVEQSGTGAIYQINKEDIYHALGVIRALLQSGRTKLATRIAQLAREHRNFEIIMNNYAEVFTNTRKGG